DFLRFAALFETKQRAAVGAAVLKRVDRAVLVARDDDRDFAEARAAIAVGRGQLRFQTEEAPGRAAEDALLLPRVEFLVRIDPVGYARETLRGPVPVHGCNRHGEPLFLLEHDLFRKPVPTFRDHALARTRAI